MKRVRGRGTGADEQPVRCFCHMEYERLREHGGVTETAEVDRDSDMEASSEPSTAHLSIAASRLETTGMAGLVSGTGVASQAGIGTDRWHEIDG